MYILRRRDRGSRSIIFMIEKVKILKVDKDTAIAEKFSYGFSCKGCSEHGLCGLNRDRKIKIRIEDNQVVREGNLVEIETQDNLSLKIAFFIYIVPLAMFFLGVISAGFIGRSQDVQLISGASLFILTYVIIYFVDKKMKVSRRYLPVIKKIISNRE